MPETVSLAAARALLLACQGLQQPASKAATKRSVQTAIRRMQLLQIDTISVVARSPYFVLYSRVGFYEQRWLDELLTAGRIFEQWAHAACFVPAEDYPLFASATHHSWAAGSARSRRWERWAAQNRRTVKHVRERISREGALRSADFENETKRGTWWDWKLEKIALEYLLVTGELMVARREGFQRVYDLGERVRPDWDDSQLLTPTEIWKRMVGNSALALGVAIEPWLRDYYRLHQRDTRAAITGLLEEGVLEEVSLEGIREPAYVHQQNWPLLRKALNGKLQPQGTFLLSPFDPIVWHRERASALFGFDYQIECYTLEHKRRYGYFTLPILHNGALIGRLDPKAHRKDAVFEIKSLHFELGVKLSPQDWQQLGTAFRACAEWHSTPQVRVVRTEPASALRTLRAALKS